MEKTSLYFKEGSGDKEYHVQLNEGLVTVQYGRRGSALTSLTKCQGCAPDKARKIYQQLINEKKAKGYHEGKDGVVYSTPVDPNQTGYKPQLLNEIDEVTAAHLIYNDGWLMQEKEDGRNIGIRVGKDNVIASNKKGIAISIPEKIIQSIERNILIPVTLCGELVGNVFKVWDMIHISFMSEDTPYITRYNMLKKLIDKMASDNVKLTRTAITEKEKVELFNEMREKNAEGVVFKKKDSLYTPGRPASGGDHLKFKFRATCSVIVGKQNEGKRSVEMWLIGEERGKKVWKGVGNITIYPNQEIPKEDSIIEVEYLYAYRGGSLFQPVLKGLRDDVSPEECTISQLKYKRESEEDDQ